MIKAASLLASLVRRKARKRKVYIDVGANTGEALVKFASSHPDFELFAIEPNPRLIDEIKRKAASLRREVTIFPAAAWLHDGTMKFYQSERHESGTVMFGKRTYEDRGWPAIDYSRSTEVPCFDFSHWLVANFDEHTRLVVKMDIEGAEYAVLEKMLADDSLSRIHRLYCEWHADRLPDMSPERHQTLKQRVAATTELRDWH
jgi:FkbM family methyltransferase